jgi:hypothetical protein
MLNGWMRRLVAVMAVAVSLLAATEARAATQLTPGQNFSGFTTAGSLYFPLAGGTLDAYIESCSGGCLTNVAFATIVGTALEFTGVGGNPISNSSVTDVTVGIEIVATNGWKFGSVGATATGSSTGYYSVGATNTIGASSAGSSTYSVLNGVVISNTSPDNFAGPPLNLGGTSSINMSIDMGTASGGTLTTTIVSVPEPGTVPLMLTGLLGLIAMFGLHRQFS